MRLGILASNNFFVEDTTNALSEYFYIRGIILKGKNDECRINRNHKIKLIFIKKKSVIDLLKFPLHIIKVEKEVEGFIVHYMNPYFAILLALGIIKKPMIYFCYGGDVHKTGIRKWLVKKALKKVDLIFVESKSEQEHIHKGYGIKKEKIKSIIWWSIGKSFKKYDNELIEQLIKKWDLTKEYVIFSPRNTIEFYNHHLLIDGLGLLDNDLKRKIQVVVTGYGDREYGEKLIGLGKKKDIEVINLGKILTPEEMAEIYNISLINANIPKNDGVARSIIEGAMCDSIPLLNNNITAYNDFFENKKNCIFVEPTPSSIAEGIKYVLDNPKIGNKVYNNNLNMISTYFNWDKNSESIYISIEKIIQEVKT